MPARARNVVVAAVAILAVLAGGAALLIGAGARSASVVQQQQNGNNACFTETLGMEPYGAIFERPEPNSHAAAAHIEEGDVKKEYAITRFK